MSGLSEVSILIGQRTSDLEKAREIFTAESRAFVSGILGGIRRTRAEPWVSGRVRVDIPREIDTEAKASAYLREVFALARADLRFKKGTNFTAVGEVKFGIEYDDGADVFAWQIALVPESRYQRIDDRIWPKWRTERGSDLPPGSVHQDKSNTVRFVSRALDAALTPEVAFNDVKGVLDFLLSTDAVLADAVGLDIPDATD
jgi:hypothetical protein